jgi:chemotaxis protein methyltransferase CheR
MPVPKTPATNLTSAQFDEISALVKELCGINLHDGKQELVRARLAKRLRALGLEHFRDYLELLRNDPGGAELTAMLDALSTNLTSFFREPVHYDYLVREVIPSLRASSGRPGRLRIWSAGCASGEEPYSIVIRLLEEVPDLESWDFKLLATDLSTAALAKARAGVYTQERLQGVPDHLLQQYFTASEQQGPTTYRAGSALRKPVQFAHLNLMEPWPMRGPFDVIFCRNVMIYFDKPTQGALVARFHDLLRPGGVLFVGHSESLTGVQHHFRYLEPTIYSAAA